MNRSTRAPGRHNVAHSLKGRIPTFYKVAHAPGVKHTSKETATCEPDEGTKSTILITTALVPAVHRETLSESQDDPGADLHLNGAVHEQD